MVQFSRLRALVLFFRHKYAYTTSSKKLNKNILKETSCRYSVPDSTNLSSRYLLGTGIVPKLNNILLGCQLAGRHIVSLCSTLESYCLHLACRSHWQNNVLWLARAYSADESVGEQHEKWWFNRHFSLQNRQAKSVFIKLHLLLFQ